MIARLLAIAVLLAAADSATDDAAATGAYPAALALAKKIGSRPAGGSGEARAHAYVERQFRAAGLTVTVQPFRVPGRGGSRNVIGVLDTPRDCLRVLMAHTDSVPPGTGADDNASGVGVLVGLAPRLAALEPDCDVWLVATGAEEREVIGTGYHVGSQALVSHVRDQNRASDLRFALSVDMVGRGKRFYLRSPQPAARPAVEGAILAAARRAHVPVRWSRDSGQGNSDHREFELAGLRGAVLEVWRGFDACHHERCDRWPRIQKGAVVRALRIAEGVAGGA